MKKIIFVVMLCCYSFALAGASAASPTQSDSLRIFSFGLSINIVQRSNPSHFTVGLFGEFQPIQFISGELILSTAYTSGNFPVQARLKLYPQQYLFLGAGYYHAGSYGNQGNYYQAGGDETQTYSGHEFFIGFIYKRTSYELGWRLSDKPYLLTYYGGKVIGSHYLREWYFVFSWRW